MTSRTNYYKSVSQIYRFHNIDGSKTGNQIPEEIYPFQTNIIDETSPYQDTESTTFDNSEIRLDSNIYTRIDIPEEDTIPEITENFEQTCTYHNKKANNNPISWGPPFWYTLHNGAYHYPEHAGPLHGIGAAWSFLQLVWPYRCQWEKGTLNGSSSSCLFL